MPKRLLSLLAPEGLLLLAVVVLYRGGWLPAAVTAAPGYVVLSVYGVCALVARRLRRNRVVLALVALALALAALLPGASGIGGPVVVVAVAVLLSLNLLVLGLVPDRAVLGRAGLVHLLAILAQAALLFTAAVRGYDRPFAWLERDFLPTWLAVAPAVPDAVLFAAGFALLALAVAGLIWPDPIRRGMLWATASLLLATHEAYIGGTPVVYLLAAGVVLVAAVVESSFALAYRDGLTGLPSRRAFNEELRRLGSRFVIAMVDVDRFKGINDRHGHDVGDQVLRLVATRLARVSGRGRAYRYGGEEFAVVFTGKRLDDVTPHLERLRAAIEESGFTIRGPDRPKRRPRRRSARKSSANRTTLNITVSIGAAERTERLVTPEEVIKAADKALYRAKNAGRNRVVT